MDNHIAIESYLFYGTPTFNFFLTDERGNIVALTDEDGTILERYRYRVYGEHEVITPAASTGKLQKITVPGRGDINLTYKATGGKRLDTVTTPEGNVLSYTYNGALMASESWSGDVTGTVSRTYNNNFRTTAVTTGGISAGYTYDNDGLLLSAGDMTITRDTESGMITGTALDSITTTQSYNSFGEISTYDAGDFSYAVTARDKLGRITEKTETVEGTFTKYNYEYDTAGRLAKVWENELLVSEYTYDDNGNRTSKNGMMLGYDDQDRLVSGAYTSYTYTANGDVLTKTNILGTTEYTHDALGNLTEVILPNNNEISYIYDGRNRLISKQVNGIVEYRLIYGGQLAPVAKVDGSGNTLETYIYGLGVNSPDYIIKDSAKYRVIKDHLGSTRMIVDASTGEVVKTLRYSEFGEITEETGTFETIFGFAGGIRDTDTSLTKFGARWYDSTTGRWMEKEPLGFRGSDNFYSYCDGDPVNRIDVDGFRQDAISDAPGFDFTMGPESDSNKVAEIIDNLKNNDDVGNLASKTRDYREKIGFSDVNARDAEYFAYAYNATLDKELVPWYLVPFAPWAALIVSTGYFYVKGTGFESTCNPPQENNASFSMIWWTLYGSLLGANERITN